MTTTAKDVVKEVLNELPDETSLEDIQYHLYIRKKIEKGLADVKNGKTMDHEEVEKRMSRWLGK